MSKERTGTIKCNQHWYESELLSEIFPDKNIVEVTNELDGALLDAIFLDHNPEITKDRFLYLQTATRLEYLNLLGFTGLEQFMIDLENAEEKETQDDESLSQFQNWELLLAFYEKNNVKIPIDELLNLAFLGYQSNNNVRLQNAINSPYISKLINEKLNSSNDLDWEEKVKTITTCALVNLVKQNNYDEISQTQKLIDQLSDAQKEYEEKWLNNYEYKRPAMAAKAAALYHLAYTVRLTADFLLEGVVKDSRQQRVDFKAYSNVLFNRADKYLELTDDYDLLTWAKSLAGVVTSLHNNSIWSRLESSGDLLSEFKTQLTSKENDYNIFSLLPSQQQILKERLLDTNPVAKVIQMPTSGGKTLMAQLAILQTFQIFQEKANVIYLVPTRALVNQVRIQLTQDFSGLGVNVISIGAAFEEDPFEDEILSSSNGVFVATYEKADMLLRTKIEWFNKLNLMVIDEAHNLNDHERGARLELLLANLINQCGDLKYLLLSPFMKGSQDVASWLGRGVDNSMTLYTDWKPSRLMLGLPQDEAIVDSNKVNHVINWHDADDPFKVQPNRTTFLENTPKNKFINLSKGEQIIELYKNVKSLGTTLCMSPGSREQCVKISHSIATNRPFKQVSDDLKIAISYAELEYGSSNSLIDCLKKGVAYHHSSLSSEMKFFIENAVKNKSIDFLAATTTIAQGINFPISTILMHSSYIGQKNGSGRNLSDIEFWNIAGRAGRVGLASKGYVIFANGGDKDVRSFNRYLDQARKPLKSALLEVFNKLDNYHDYTSIAKLYRKETTLRPFIQYIAHALVVHGRKYVFEQLEIILQSSLANKQIDNVLTRRKVRGLAKSYLDMFVDNVELNKAQVAHVFFNQAVSGMKIATATTRKYLDLLVKKGRADCEWRKIRHETQGIRTLKFYTVYK